MNAFETNYSVMASVRVWYISLLPLYSPLPQGVAITFGKPCYVRSACVYGGAPKGPQIRDLQDGMFVCVCTC